MKVFELWTLGTPDKPERRATITEINNLRIHTWACDDLIEHGRFMILVSTSAGYLIPEETGFEVRTCLTPLFFDEETNRPDAKGVPR